MKGTKIAGLLILTLSLALSGCVTRTYNLTRDRIDQDLTPASGNRGYLMGKAPEPSERKSERTVRVFEIEIGRRKQTAASFSPATSMPLTASEETTSIQETVIEEEIPTGSFENYTVQKNDTLQKISQKFYGTTKKWPKIYDANKDVLRGPDKLYPGQTLKIPSEGIKKETKATEIQENLK